MAAAFKLERRLVVRVSNREGFLNVTEMGTQTTTVLYVLLLAAVIVVVDVLFFRNAFWERLAVNTGIVLIFTAVYFRFLKRP